jgi:DNA replication protein DnaC
MLIEPTLEKMRAMRLSKMADSLQEKLGRPDHQSLSHAEFVSFLIDEEYQHRQNGKLTANLRRARFKEPQACIENINYKFKRDLPKKTVIELAQLHWVRRKQNVIFTGASGLGKSYLAQALGHHACREGFIVMYFRATMLYQQLLVAKADGSYLNKIKALKKAHILILDDFGISPVDTETRQDIYEIVEDRHQVSSLMITSQLPTDKWHQYLGGGMISDGVCDRLFSNAHKIDIKGDTCRKPLTELT